VTRRIPSVTVAWLLAVIIAVVTVGAVATPAPIASAAPDPGDKACAGVIAKGNQDAARRDAHNARPHVFEVPRQQAEADAYDAEAREIDGALASDRAALAQCQAALSKLLDAGRTTYAPDPGSRAAQSQIAKLAALPQVPTTWVPPAPPPPPRRSTIPKDSPVRGIYDILRTDNPGDLGDAMFQGAPRPRVGDPDPAYPGQTIAGVDGQPDVAADHIVPLAELVQLPGFARLSPENQWLVAHAPVNFQWLSRRANTAKNSGYAGRVKAADPAWASAQDRLQQSTRQTLTDLIQSLLGAQ
jgi:hypothetical protein